MFSNVVYNWFGDFTTPAAQNNKTNELIRLFSKKKRGVGRGLNSVVRSHVIQCC